ncbi:MAG: CinA family protein [Opitutaceae bacterium]|nr:CinA family protein [Opitutaceae bacterium]
MDFGQELKQLLLREPRWTLAAAESLTCGRVQARIGAVSGASNFFLGGLTAYSLDQKVRHLGVDRVHAESVCGVSQRVAEEMARGASALFGSDLAVGTTGYAEAAAERGVRTPLAWWALWHDLRDGRAAVRSGLIEAPGTERTRMQELVADIVLGELVRYLREVRGQAPGPAPSPFK